MSADPLTLALSFLPQGNLPPPPEAGQVLQSMLDVNPAVGYGQGGLYAKAPEQVSENPAYNAAHNLGRLFQGGSGVEGTLGGTGSVVAQALGDLPAASGAMGTLMGTASTNKAMLQRLPDFYQDLQRGVGDEQLLKQHGWFIDKDLQPKYEIPDTNMRFSPEALAEIGKIQQQGDQGIQRVFKFWDAVDHPELKNSAPWLENIRLAFDPDPASYRTGHRGRMETGQDGRMTLYTGGPDATWAPVSDLVLPTELDLRKILGHETEHGISNYHPDWAGGANPNYTQYELAKIPGRFEAWNEVDKTANNARQQITAALASISARWKQLMAVRKNLPFEERIKTDSIPLYFNLPEYKQLEQIRRLSYEARTNPAKLQSMLSIIDALGPEFNDLKNTSIKPFLRSLDNWYRQPYATDDAFDLYQARLDEVNARTVEERIGMSPKELMAEAFTETRNRVYPHDRIIPWYDFSVPRSEAERARAAPGTNIRIPTGAK